MIRLKTLGTPKLERDDGLPGAEATQRRPLAQTLYALRRDLSGAEVVVGTSSLRLNSLTIETDVAKFEDAVTRGDADRAVALYGGPSWTASISARRRSSSAGWSRSGDG